MATFPERLHHAIRRKRTPALVGIDPRFDMLPEPIVAAARRRGTDDTDELKAAAIEEFSLRLVDVVAPLVSAVKPQAAFFEELGPAGSAALKRVIYRAREAGLIVICDAKRGDIGSTAEVYARAYLAGEDAEAAPWGADALTVNPYLGADTLKPFVDIAVERNAGIYVLVRTSNPGAATFQDVGGEESPLFHRVAKVVEELSVKHSGGEEFGPVGAVVGATYPDELKRLRVLMPHAPFLVPGYGSQGGTAQDVAAAFNSNGLGALVNSSRAINFAYSRPPYQEQFGPDRWEEAIEAATRDMIADLASAVYDNRFPD